MSYMPCVERLGFIIIIIIYQLSELCLHFPPRSSLPWALRKQERALTLQNFCGV